MRFFKLPFLLAFGLLMFMDCSHSNNIRRSLEEQGTTREDLVRENRAERSYQTIFGLASFYGEDFHGRKTANGEIYDMYAMTAAHRTLPFGTVCKITNTENGKSAQIRVNDRGPFIEGRIMDLSFGAAQAIDAVRSGVVKVKIEIISGPDE